MARTSAVVGASSSRMARRLFDDGDRVAIPGGLLVDGIVRGSSFSPAFANARRSGIACTCGRDLASTLGPDRIGAQAVVLPVVSEIIQEQSLSHVI